MEKKEVVLREAQFNPKVCVYWLLSGTIIMFVTIVLIPLIPVWLVFGYIFTKKYLNSMKCTLTDRSLKVEKGILTRVEKNTPLDKVTDLGLVQGPIMRAFDIEAISIETAGQSGIGPLAQLTGIIGGRAFRDAVLEQRDKVTDTARPDTPAAAAPAPSAEDAGMLREIRDSLLRIEGLLEKRTRENN